MLYHISNFVLGLPRYTKRIIVVTLDISLCVLTVWLAFFLRLDEWIRLSGNASFQPLWAVITAIIVALPLFITHGFYRVIFRYSGLLAIAAIIRVFILYSFFYAAIVTAIGLPNVPRSIGIIQPLLLFVAISATRLLAHAWLKNEYHSQLHIANLPKALIYGAGRAGRQLASGLDDSCEMNIIGFLDDNLSLQNNVLNGKPIFSPTKVAKIIKNQGITHILLAMPSISRQRRNKILEQMEQHQVIVHTLPRLIDLAEGRITVSDLRELDIDDLLGREPVPPDDGLLAKNITNKVVLITGAGGSIGSELCRQVLQLQPHKLLLIDNSEFALYAIHAELEHKHIRTSKLQLVPLLASVQDPERMQTIMHTWHPDTIYHAAAYKHVPMVESNPIEGIKNNVFGTLITAQAAIKYNVRDFVLISTDKAVRPTNVMGASKRVAELCLQALNTKQLAIDSNQTTLETANIQPTKLSMVRFGNVLGSSGSVIPKFRKQIREGGPITLTHPDINRFFMTIPEAAQLVIQAGAMAQGGDVFVLDMGKPIKIFDLAQRMIKLSGLTVRNEADPDGDIEIIITGLRPGEKLHEELLLGKDPYPTAHPRILRAQDPFIPWEQLEIDINALKTASHNQDASTVLTILKRLVGGYHPSHEVVDMLQCDYA